jgi:hypothetical protein
VDGLALSDDRMRGNMAERILMIAGIAGIENCAAVLSKQFQMTVETAASRREGVAALRRHEYALVVIDESLLQADEDAADALLKHIGCAVPLEINFAISGTGRLVREVRSALSRRVRERELAVQAVAASLQSELRDIATGLLLQSQLALAEPEIPPRLAGRIQASVELTGMLGMRLGGSNLCVPAAICAHAAGSAPAVRVSAETELPAAPLFGSESARGGKRTVGKGRSEANGSYASSVAGSPSAGTRPGSQGL